MNCRPSILATAAAVAVLAVSGCTGKAKKTRRLEVAEKYYQAENYPSAEITYKNILQANPRDPVALHRMGTIWLRRGGLIPAARFLTDAKKLDPANLELKVDLGEALLGLGYAADARKEMMEVLDVQPLHERALGFLAESSVTQDGMMEAYSYLNTVTDGDSSAGVHIAKAMLALRKNDLAAAEVQITRALQIDPKSATAHSLLATLHLIRNENDQAETAFLTAIKLSPQHTVEKFKYALFLMRIDKTDQALAYLEKVNKELPDFLPAWRLRAQIAGTAKKFDEANKLLDTVLRMNPIDVEATIMRAEIMITLGDGMKAITLLKEIKQESPPNPFIEFLLGRGYLVTNNYSLAAEALDRAIALNPNYAEAIMTKAKLDLTEGRTPVAIAALEKLTAKYPGTTAVQLLLVDAYRAAGRLEDATGALISESAAAKAGDFRPHLNLGIVLRSQGKLEEARAAFNKAAEVAPDNLMVLFQRVTLELAEKKYPEAHAIAAAQMKKHPEGVAAYYLDGLIYEQEQEWTKAEESLQHAIKLEVNLFPAYDALVRVYTASNRMDDAAKQLEALLLGNPENVPALMQLGALYQKMGRTDDAMARYDKLLKRDPDFAPALNNVALLILHKTGNADKAYPTIQQARSLLPNEPAIADTMGWIVYQRGEYKRAMELFEEAAPMMTGDPSVIYHLGLAYYQMGRLEDSREQLRKVVAMEQDFDGKADAVAALADIDALESAKTVDELKAFLAKKPKNLAAVLRLGNQFEKDGRFSEAASSFQDALKLNPEIAEANLQLAKIYAGPLNQAEQALPFARKAKEMDPNNAATSAAIGAIALKTGNYDWAYTLLSDASTRIADKAPVLHDLAWAAYGLGRVPEARQVMTRLVDLHASAEQTAEAERFMKLTAIDPKDASAAAKEIDEALAKEPDYLPALVLKAAALEASDPSAAEKSYQAILAKFPQFTPVQKGLARVYSKDPSKLNLAEPMAMAARQKLRDDVEITAILARINFLQKDYSYTLDLVSEISKSRELTAEELFWQGVSLANAGRKDDAVKALESALTKKPAGADADAATRLLGELKQ